MLSREKALNCLSGEWSFTGSVNGFGRDFRERDAVIRPLGDLSIIFPVHEDQRQDAEIHEIGAVDAGHRQGDDGPDAEMARGQRRVFAAGALPVVLTRHDDAVAARFGDGTGALHEVGVHAHEHVFGNGRDIGAQGEDFRARGHDVVGGDVVAEADHDVGFEHVSGRVEAGEFLQRHDVRAAQDFHALAVFRREHEQVPDGRRIGG